ncbi:MAG: glycosyltransferase family 39 protein, partial [Anaerolineales bacterium]|nr:glycosyltransferase family 39 protein [Anaerolineales bacterium]
MLKNKFVLILLILLLAFVLRTYALTAVPPGLTHDEANHGREALDILDGVLLFYFPLNYGSEPLYSYTAAGSMLLFGKSLFSLRLVNVVFGVLAIGATYLWVQRAFDRRSALLTAVLLAVSFWPLAAGRQALRAGMLPFFMVGAVWYFWQIAAPPGEKQPHKTAWGAAVGFGVCVAITLHIYLAARVAWLIFPLFIIYLAVAHRDRFRQAWRPALLGLGVAGVLVVPMFTFLQRNPQAQTRLTMLDGPLQQLSSGNLQPIWDNASEALLAFVWPGYGDMFLAYNIPGRPVFDGVTAVFFLVGLGVAAW